MAAIKTFIGSNTSLTVAQSDLIIYGSSGGNEIVRIRAGVTGLKLDANIERIDLTETVASYQFVYVAGAGLQIQNSSGNVIATLASLNQNVKIAFYDGAATLVQSGRSTFTLGGLTVSTITAGVLSPTLTTAAGDYSTFRLIITKDTGISSVISSAFNTYDGTTATVNATGMDASQVAAVAEYAVKIAAGGITGTISLNNTQFNALQTALSASLATITVTDITLAATALAAMDTKSDNPVNATAVTTVTGTASELAAFAIAAGISRFANFNATITDAPTLAQLATIDGANGSGALNYSTVTGIAADFAQTNGTATAGITYVANKNITVTDAATLAQLAAIHTAQNDGTKTLSYTAVIDAAATLANNVTNGSVKYVKDAIIVTVTDSGSVAATLLSAIGGATTGTVTAANVTTVTGLATDVTAALVTTTTLVTTRANPDIILSDSGTVAATVLSGIGGLTTGNVTAPNVTTVTGLTSDVTAALITSATSVAITNPIITLNDSGSIAAMVLSAIGAITTSAVTGSNISAVTGSASEIEAALVTDATKVTVAVNAAVTISDTLNVAQLKAINNATTGVITLNDKSGALSGNAADIFAALDGITNYTGTITIIDQPTVEQLKAINNAASGTITLQVNSGALSGIAADLYAALYGIRSYTGTVAITDSATVAELTEINAATSGLITAASTTLVGTAAAIKVVTDAISSSGDKISLGTMAGQVSNVPVTINNAPTVAELKSINNATSGAITLNVTNGALEGSATDLFDALAGITNYAGAITISNAPNVSELKAINDATTGEITLSDASGALSGAAADVASALAGTITQHTGAVTISDSNSLAATLLSTINAKTNGLITAANVTTLTGSASEITAVTNASSAEIALPALRTLSLSDAVLTDTFNGTAFSQSPITITLANVSGNVITSVDATVDVGKVLKIDGSTLTGANALTFNGNLETNGKFSVTGGAGADSITSGSSADSITGGAGADSITGGAGNDVLYGGDGNNNDNVTDTFHYYFNTNEGTDTIFDFDAGGSGTATATQDKIYIHGTGLTFADVTVTELGVTVVSFNGTAPTTKIVLTGVSLTNISADDFIFGA